jgi:hypothetical protein
MLDESEKLTFTQKVHDLIKKSDLWSKVGQYFSTILSDKS